MKIGVFDSGIGGKAVAHSLARDFSDAEIIYIHDREHMPYGGRDKKDIIRLNETALQPILNNTCECIVIACNTATAAAIEYLRASYPNEKFVGLEPMLKPAAALTQTSTIAICATLYTLSSERYKNLKHEYANLYSLSLD